MFRRRLSLALAAGASLLSSSGMTWAQSNCPPENVNAAIDLFAQQPFSAVSWRMLNGLGAPNVEADGAYSGAKSANDIWRRQVKALAPDMPELQDLSYECRMTYPLEVLEARVATLGAGDPYIKQWLKSQARVLKACRGAGDDATVLPPPLEVKPEVVDLQQDDRAYQDASVAFYGQDKSKALQLFRAIGASRSVHGAAARYNVANLLANAKNVVEARKEAAAILSDPSLASVHGITRELQGYIANLEDTAEGWSQLIDNTVATLTQPSTAVSATPKSQAEYAAALFDIEFVGVRDKQDDWWVRGVLPENPTLSKALVDASRNHPLALWMMTGKSILAMQGRAPWSMEGARWNAWASSYVDRAMEIRPAGAGITGSAKDLIDALKSGSDDVSRSVLWGKAKHAAEQSVVSCGEAPETAAVSELALQASRVSALVGRYDEVYDNLSALPIASSNAYMDRILPKLMQHVLSTGNAEEGRRLRDHLLTPMLFAAVRKRAEHERDAALGTFGDFMAWVAEDEAKFLEALALGSAKLSNPVLNLLPAKTLHRLANHAVFNEEQKALLSRAAWTRDFARGRTASKSTTEAMLNLNPEIKSALEKVRAEHPKLREDRVWLLTILRNPRFGILVNSPDWTSALEDQRPNFSEIDLYDHNDKNWWCPLEVDRQLGALRNAVDEYSGLTAARGFNSTELKPVLEDGALAAAESARDGLLKSHPMVKAVDWSEVRSLARAASAPKTLAQAATRWGKASKGVDGAPEALALAMRVVRYGCDWHGGHKAYSKPLLEVLQTKFKDTAFAKQTPYWFDCLHAEWDANYNKVTTCKPKEWPKQARLR